MNTSKRIMGFALLVFGVIYLYWRSDVLFETFRGTKQVDYSLLIVPGVLFLLGFGLLFSRNRKSTEA